MRNHDWNQFSPLFPSETELFSEKKKKGARIHLPALPPIGLRAMPGDAAILQGFLSYFALSNAMNDAYCRVSTALFLAQEAVDQIEYFVDSNAMEV